MVSFRNRFCFSLSNKNPYELAVTWGKQGLVKSTMCTKGKEH